jgi:hypothetical protein
MRDKQNPSLDEDESLPELDEESTREKSETSRGYYYDDATGYEIYEDEDETDEDVDGEQSE